MSSPVRHLPLEHLSPESLSAAGPQELRRIGVEIRDFLIGSVCRTGGHLGPNLGVVEISLALHRCFRSPRDQIIWDTGHQAYVHKLITGRAGLFGTLRKSGGLSGYPSRRESGHDLVENSHASTALSYADGLARSNVLRGRDSFVVAVVGDGSLTGGMAWEALNNIGGRRPERLIVVLNDNGRSYDPTVGALAEHLQRLADGAERPRTNVFEALGFAYVGPVDGHDVTAIEEAFAEAKASGRPVVVHCRTVKGRGYAPAEDDLVDHLHAVRPQQAPNGVDAARPSWTSVFSSELLAIADNRPDVVAVTAAMLQPVGLGPFAARHPHRVFDVGLAEQHAVTCSAGMAMGGLHPVVPIYSTFVNRAFDQILLDCGLHDCAVTLVLDRGGITGDDGPSHHGMWDLSTLQVVPNIRIAAPRDACTLRRELRDAVDWSEGPTVVRFPKGAMAPDIEAVERHDGIDVLVGVALPHHRRDVLIVAIGSMAEACLDAARLLSEHGITSTVVDPCWVAPLNPALCEMAARHRVVVSAEDNVRRGGIGSALLALLHDQDTSPPPVASVAIAAEFIPHGSRDEILTRMGLTGPGIASTAYDLLCRTFSERDCYESWHARSQYIDSEVGPTAEKEA